MGVRRSTFANTRRGHSGSQYPESSRLPVPTADLELYPPSSKPLLATTPSCRAPRSWLMDRGHASSCAHDAGVAPPDSTRHQPPAGTSSEPKELLLGKDGGACSDSRSQPDLKAREPHIDIAEVIGSIP